MHTGSHTRVRFRQVPGSSEGRYTSVRFTYLALVSGSVFGFGSNQPVATKKMSMPYMHLHTH